MWQPNKRLEPIQQAPHKKPGFQEQFQQNMSGVMGPRPAGFTQNNSFLNQQKQKEQNQKTINSQKVEIHILRNITNGEINAFPEPVRKNGIKKADDHRIEDLGEDNLDYLLNCAIKADEIRHSNHLENLKNGKFVRITDQMLRDKELQDDEDDEEQGEQIDQFSADLYQVIKTVNVLIIKLLYFVQGIFMGFCLMHTVILNQQQTEDEGLAYYAIQGHRLGQSMQVLALICLVGSIHLYYQAGQGLNRSNRAQTNTFDEDKLLYSKSKFILFIYFVIDILVIVCHSLIARISDNALDIDLYGPADQSVRSQLLAGTYSERLQGQILTDPTKYDDFKSYYSTYSILTIVITVLAIFGWLTAVSNIKSPIDYSLLHHDELQDYDDDSDNDSLEL